MKRVSRYLAVLFMCIMLTGCSNGFAQKEYNAIDKIEEVKDRYAAESYVFSPIDGGYSLVVARFDGRETLWTKTLEDNKDIEIEIKLSLSKGTAKVVHIDEDGGVLTILECTEDNSADGYVAKTVSLKKGLNRIKIVGYGCRDIDLELLSSAFEE